MFRFLFLLAMFSLAAIAWLVWGLFRRALFKRRTDRASRQFRRHRPALEGQLFAAAAASGKPRGLIWEKCDLHDGLVLARDRANGELVGLVGVTIGFKAVAGGTLENVEAVGNLRAATAVFHWNGRQWSTQGRAVFNLEPREVIDRYRSSLDVVAIEHATA